MVEVVIEVIRKNNQWHWDNSPISAAFTYYGAVLIAPELFREESLGLRCPGYHLNQTSADTATSSSNTCEGQHIARYIQIEKDWKSFI